MNPLIIIQARLNSTRLPGKVMASLCGRPLIFYLIDRALKSAASWPRIVVATPAIDAGAIAAPMSRNLSVDVWGYAIPDDDVANRVALTLKQWGNPDIFVRLCGDSPLLDPALIDAAIALYEPPYLEIVSPVGCVEVCDTAAFLERLPEMSIHEREHVTGRLRPQGRTIRIGGGPRLVVDTQEDFDRVAAVIGRMDRPHVEYGWRECCALQF